MPRSLLLLSLLPALLAAAPPTRETKAERQRRLNKTIREVAGSAEYLRSVPKRFGTLQAVDPARRQVTILFERERAARAWPLSVDAEIKVLGWWGRLDQLVVGDRVWAWFQTNRKGVPVALAMLADEVSEQDIHGGGPRVERVTSGEIVVKGESGPARTLALPAETIGKIAAGQRIYLQSAGPRARLVLDAAAFEARRKGQKEALRKRWLAEGLPGTVSFVHRFSGEMDLMLDHEALRWGRSLKLGDKVTLLADPPVKAVVKSVGPWRERTLVRLVAKSRDLTDLTPGLRLNLRRPAPPAEVDRSVLPPDVDRPRATKAEREEWFLASVYCTCGVSGNVCTGHFYTLASCNPNGCGMPRAMRRDVGEMIDKGMSDRQIFEALLKEHGPDLLRPHLLP